MAVHKKIHAETSFKTGKIFYNAIYFNDKLNTYSFFPRGKQKKKIIIHENLNDNDRDKEDIKLLIRHVLNSESKRTAKDDIFQRPKLSTIYEKRLLQTI